MPANFAQALGLVISGMAPTPLPVAVVVLVVGSVLPPNHSGPYAAMKPATPAAMMACLRLSLLKVSLRAWPMLPLLLIVLTAPVEASEAAPLAKATLAQPAATASVVAVAATPALNADPDAAPAPIAVLAAP
ncbi:hypothetical protein D9M71_600090 [compost metagenome]